MTEETEDLSGDMQVEFSAPEPIFLPTEEGCICVTDLYGLSEALGFDILALQSFKGNLLAMGADRRWIDVEKALDNKPKIATLKKH